MSDLEKSLQLGLFDAPVRIEGYTRRDGTRVEAHQSKRKHALKVDAPAGGKPRKVKAGAIVTWQRNGKRVAGEVISDPDAHGYIRVRVTEAQKGSAKVGAVLPQALSGVTVLRAAPPRKPKAERVADLPGLLFAAPPPAGASAPAEVPTPAAAEAITLPQFGAADDATPAMRRADNAAALAILAAKRNDELTPADKAVLARYSGRGGIGDSLNEYYTRPDVAAGMWSVLQRLGVPGANGMEPSCGTGVFMHTAPEGLSLTGVEMDGTSSRIAGVLHPRHEVVESSLEAFATRDARTFDFVVGNPPFGLRGALLAQDKKDIPRAEQYFVDTALDKTNEGGIVALVLPSGVLDASSARRLRRQWLCKAQFLGALRMPNTAFRHSQTDVTTDVVFFRRRAPDIGQALQTLDDDRLDKLGVLDAEFIDGGYFAGRGAQNVLGRMEEGWRAKAGMGQDITVVGSMHGVADAVAAFEPDTVSAAVDWPRLREVLDDEAVRERAMRATLRRPYDVARIGDVRVIDGTAYILQGDPPRWHLAAQSPDAPVEPSHVDEGRKLGARIEAFANGEGAAADIVDALQDYVARHGVPRKDLALRRAAQHDAALHRLLAAVREDGSFSDLLTGQGPETGVTLEAAADRLSLANGEFSVDELMHEYPGLDAETVEDQLYASDRFALLPGGKWASMAQYLTGDLWPKLDAARAALEGADAAASAKLQQQIAALDRAIDPKALDDVEVELNSGWVPLPVIEAFFHDRLRTYLEVHPSASSRAKPCSLTFDKGVFTVTGFTGGHDALLEKYLNRTGVREEDWPQVNSLNHQFKQWLCASEHRAAAEDLYNRKFRGYIKPRFSDEPMAVPGMREDLAPHGYHWAGVRWALAHGKGIIAADVGVGKTLRALIMARLMKAHGQAKKPLIVVPKSVLANWVAEIGKWFPDSSVLTIGESYTVGKDGQTKAVVDSAAVRNQKLHDLAQNDYDFALITLPAWNDVDISAVTKEQYVQSDFWTQRSESLGQAGDKRRRQIREAYEQSIAKRDFEKRTDVINFEDLNVDAIIADESHFAKNVFAARNRFGQQPKFLGGSGLSNQALDMQYKARWVREQNGGKNVYFLTATPTKNSPLEVYSMLSHIAPEEFERLGIRNSEEFLDRFCEFKRDLALGVDGEIEEALITSGFKNMDELREVMSRYIDRTTADDVGLKLPQPQSVEHLVDMTSEQQAAYAQLRAAAAGDEGADTHIFSLMDRMAKAAMDLELLDPAAYAGAESPKLTEAAKAIRTGAADGGQIVFTENVATHAKLRKMLIKAGFKPSEVAIINAQEAKSSLARQRIVDDYNAGKIKVVIGNTATMGEGLNLQKNTADIHDLDIPWEPASLQQRHGRGVRQGNVNEAVRIHRYLSKGSFDGYRYQTVSAKRDWQEQLWKGGNRIENLAAQSAFSRDELMIMLSADPESARKAYEDNAAAAKARIAAGLRAEAGSEFVRFQSLTKSYKGIKDKGTASARRLAQQIARSRTRIESNPHFDAKDALDDPSAAVVDAATGVAFRPQTVVELPVKDKQPLNWADGTHRFVVVGVHPDSGVVQLRPYGQAVSAISAYAKDIASRATIHPLDAEAEGAEAASSKLMPLAQRAAALAGKDEDAKARVAAAAADVIRQATTDRQWHATPERRAKLWLGVEHAVREALPDVKDEQLQKLLDEAELTVALQAVGKTGAEVKSPKDLVGIPEAAIVANLGTISRRLKNCSLTYDTGSDYSTQGFLIAPDGAAKAAPSYDTRKLLGDHRFALPIEADRQRMLEAWKREEGGRQYSTYMQSPKSKNHHNLARMSGVELRYGGRYTDSGNNAFDAGLKQLFGDGAVAEARQAFHAEARERALKADGFTAKLAALLPAQPSAGYGGKGVLRWNADDVRLLADAAQQQGILDADTSGALPKGVPDFVFERSGSYRYDISKVRQALMSAASGAGDEALAQRIKDMA